MSHEFYQVMVGDPAISQYSWKQLARWSLEYSCLPDQMKEQALKIFDASWNTFCEDIVRDYEGLMKGDEIDEDKVGEAYRNLDMKEHDN